MQPGLIRHEDLRFGLLFGLFEDSLPDGWGLLLMDRAFRARGIDPATVSPLDRLLYLGTRTMGALTYHPPADRSTSDRAIIDLTLFQRFVTLCAGRVGQLLNFNSLAADTGISRQTASNWLSLLEVSYIVFRLPPYFVNIAKRLVKSPKLYFYDVGLASFLLGLENTLHVSRDPLRGNLFENMVVMEALKYRLHRGRRSTCTFTGIATATRWTCWLISVRTSSRSK